MGLMDKFLKTSEEEQVENTNSTDSYYNCIKAADALTEDGKSKMILLEPRAYSESYQIIDHLKGRNAVVVNLKRVTPTQAKRIVDFLSGTLYAINGDLQKLGGGIFLCTPNSINVEGKISDESQTVKTSKKLKEEKEEEIDW